jgi:hypothetical protein
LTKLEGPKDPYRSFIERRSQGIPSTSSRTNKRKSGNKERKEEKKRKQKSYNRFWIHKSKVATYLALALRIRIFSSFK